ncbi:DUF7263 family protein [Haloglomus litoreum]|uniref:DUF7263 family protein n=1 Tax=Haloglomus litoreum TaxID=3034026 RepID=UPI0023E7FE7E|nr:hypothetical protein [Haloglomus sp. DT116]
MNLPALVVALLVVTSTLGVALTLADGAFAGADRQPGERRVATALAERLVAADAAHTTRANVLNESQLADADLAARFPVVGDHEVRVRLDDRTVLRRGDATGGVTVRRVVLVRNQRWVERTPPLAADATTLPRRTDRVTLDIAAAPNVTTVRANDRVVLYDPDGLAGNYTVRTSRFETLRLSFTAADRLERGDVVVAYRAARTTKATLGVTVDA